MLKNYLKIAVRNILRFKVYSLINILGLAAGITCFIILSLFVKDELSYDRYNKNSDRIYRVYVKITFNGKENTNAKTAAPMGPVLMHEYPEVQNYARIGYTGDYVFKYKDKVFREYSIYTADSSIFDVFTMKFLAGDAKKALSKPYSIVLTETAAKKYFGNEYPVGKMITDSKNNTYQVTGLVQDFPYNSHFGCDVFLSMSTIPENENGGWLNSSYTTYIVLKRGTDPKVFEGKLNSYVIKYVAPEIEKLLGMPIKQISSQGISYKLFIQPLTSIYLQSYRTYGIDPNTEWGNERSGDIMYVYIFSAIAFAILLVAVINFMNLSTARSEKRSKEVGIRKTLGSDKLKLIVQFVTESVLMCAFAVLLALGLLEVIIPAFNSLVGKELKMEYFNNLLTIPAIIGFTIIVGIIAGSYPAFYMSSFQPAQMLKPSNNKRSRKGRARNILVVFQFAVSITLLISTIIIKNQLAYVQNKNLGFNKENLVSITNISTLGDRAEPFKQDLLKNSNISSVSLSSYLFTTGIPGGGYLFNKRTGENLLSFQEIYADYDFLNAFQIGMKDGRFFSKEFPSDSNAVIINQAAVNEFGLNNPVGKELNRVGRKDVEGEAGTYKIIGVMKDFNYESLHQQIRPLVFHLGTPPQPGYCMNLKVQAGNIESTLQYMKNTWHKFAGRENIHYVFVNDHIARLYDSEKATSTVAGIFSFLAIFIACLGLFGLAAFVTEQRTKEIGIRKTLGATVPEIVFILSKEFSFWVILANIIAWPVAYYFMDKWLQNFAYRSEISIWAFIISGISALVIAWLTISVHAIKAATANPIKSLKYE
ncbi:MAG: ABC transporter permease [Ignavibacteriaceae bacterium]|nr:ABC transporter permease [Ignavibacteriaceae bacterium]